MEEKARSEALEEKARSEAVAPENAHLQAIDTEIHNAKAYQEILRRSLLLSILTCCFFGRPLFLFGRPDFEGAVKN